MNHISNNSNNDLILNENPNQSHEENLNEEKKHRGKLRKVDNYQGKYKKMNSGKYPYKKSISSKSNIKVNKKNSKLKKIVNNPNSEKIEVIIKNEKNFNLVPQSIIENGTLNSNENEKKNFNNPIIEFDEVKFDKKSSIAKISNHKNIKKFEKSNIRDTSNNSNNLKQILPISSLMNNNTNNNTVNINKSVNGNNKYNKKNQMSSYQLAVKKRFLRVFPENFVNVLKRFFNNINKLF